MQLLPLCLLTSKSITHFCYSHILFSLLNKCPSDFNLSPFTAIQNIAANTLSLNLATKYREVMTFLYSPKDYFCFQDKLHLEQFLLFNPCNYFVAIVQQLSCVRNWVTSWTVGPAKTPGIILHPEPFLTKPMVQICTTLGNCQSLLKGEQGPTLALTQKKKACLHCRCCHTRNALSILDTVLVQWQDIIWLQIASSCLASIQPPGLQNGEFMNKTQVHGISWAGSRAGLVEGGSVENLLQYTLPNCFMFALCCPLGRNFLCVWISNTNFKLLVKVLCSDDST